MIKTIIFDIGNVLASFSWGEYFHALDYDEQTINRLIDATVHNSDWRELDLGILSYEEVINLFVKKDPLIEKELRTTLTSMKGIVSRLPYVVPWLTQLKKDGYQILFLSNFSEKILNDCAEAMDFLSLTDGGIFSFRVHLVKPNPAIYQLLIDTYHLNPAESIFIDDREDNIAAARKCGLLGIVFENQIQTIKALIEYGVK